MTREAHSGPHRAYAQVTAARPLPQQERRHPDTEEVVVYTTSSGAVCGGVTTGIFCTISDSRVSGEEDL